MNKELSVAKSVTPQVQVPPMTAERKEWAKKKLENHMKEETKLVKGIFQFFECPGTQAKITVKKYAHEVFAKEMMDGLEYEIPLYVARFLNGIDVTAEAINGRLGTCSYPVHSHIMDQNGMPIVSHEKRKKRFGFQSLEFGAA